MLRPGVKGMSENIKVRSVVGRFLEHSRTFNFVERGKSSWLVGSADLMPRNLDYRLEVVVLVEDPKAQQRLGNVFELLFEDNTAWKLSPDGSWQRLSPKKGDRPQPSQAALMRSARRRRRPATTLARNR